MALNCLPSIRYSPPGIDPAAIGGVYIFLKNDDGYWGGEGAFGSLASANLLACSDPDNNGYYCPDPADLVGLPAGTYEYFGKVKRGMDPDPASDGAAIGGDDDWEWNGSVGLALGQIVAANTGSGEAPPVSFESGEGVTTE